MIWFLYGSTRQEALGLVPLFLSEDDPRPAREQIDDNYAHGGGWMPLKGFQLLPSGLLKYPGDPPFRPLAETSLREEIIRFYEHSWLMILQKDGSYEISRID